MPLQEIIALENEMTLQQFSGHQLFLAPSSCGAKGNGILIHNRWTSLVKGFHTNGDFNCWLDLDFCPGDRGKLLRLHSARLRHSGFSDDDFGLSPDTVSHALDKHRYNIVGFDANAVVGSNIQHYDTDSEQSFQDRRYIGPWGEGTRSTRGVVLPEWARMHRLAFANTHFYSRSDGATHTHWSTKVRSQIDFIMVPCSDIEHCSEVAVLENLVCSSDHSVVCLSLTLPVHKVGKAGDTKDKGLQRRPKPIGWRCDKPETLNTEITARLHDAQDLGDFNNMARDI